MTPLLEEQMPKHLASKLVDVMKIDLKASDQEILHGNAGADAGRGCKNRRGEGRALLREYRGRGLAIIGPEAVLEALANGQVDELLISAALERTHGEEQQIDAILAPEVPDSTGGTESDEPRSVLIADFWLLRRSRLTLRLFH